MLALELRACACQAGVLPLSHTPNSAATPSAQPPCVDGAGNSKYMPGGSVDGHLSDLLAEPALSLITLYVRRKEGSEGNSWGCWVLGFLFH